MDPAINLRPGTADARMLLSELDMIRTMRAEYEAAAEPLQEAAE